MRPRGFSLLEMLAVIVVFGVLLVIGIPFVMRSAGENRVNVAQQIFAQAVHRARYLATSQNCPYCVKVDTATKTVSVFPDNDWNAQPDAGSSMPTLNLKLDNKITVSTPAFGQYKSPAPTGTNVIMFEPSGVINSDYSAAPANTYNSIATPKLSLSSSSLGYTTTLSVYVGRFGALTIVQE